MESDETITVEVCYIKPPREFLRTLTLPCGSTLGEAVELSGLRQFDPELDLDTCKVGIFSVRQTFDTVLRARDRIEIYRPLLIDPKEARRRRAKS